MTAKKPAKPRVYHVTAKAIAELSGYPETAMNRRHDGCLTFERWHVVLRDAEALTRAVKKGGKK